MGSDRRLSTPGGPARRAALAGWVADATDRSEPADVVAAAACSLAAMASLPIDDEAAPPLIRDRSRDGSRFEPPEGMVLDAWDLGIVHEATHDGSIRRRRGVHYTPRSVARGLAAIALEGADHATTVCDPAVGGGAFLLAAAEVLHHDGASPDDVLGRLHGIDIDPLAIAVAEASLALWGASGGQWPRASPRLRVADALDTDPGAGALHRPVDVVIGNPPFQSQLASGTARDPATLAALRRRWGVDAGPYCDTAGWFLLAALELAAPGGRIVLVLPQSLLASADAGPVRERLSEQAALMGFWSGDRGVFAADVRVFAPVLMVGAGAAGTARRGPVRCWSGPDVVAGVALPAPTVPDRWSELAASAAGVPAVAVGGAVALGSWCEATAGFRDQFYGLAPHTIELATHDGVEGDPARLAAPNESPAVGPTQLSLPGVEEAAVCGDEQSGGPFPLVTVGMIEPLACRWGSGRTYRFAGRRWASPAVDIAALERADPTLARWVRARLVPKVLVATQTKVVEAVVDTDGRWIPSTPVIAVTAAAGRLAHVAAALTSPVVTAAAMGASAGTSLSGNTIKMSARQLLALPTPVDHDAWDEGARLVEAITDASVERVDGLARLGRVMIAAAGPGIEDPEALFAWWWERVPKA
ncbi:MAG: class I SAM-dependent DNA methyltransferase [Acidimicrobiales bacterium]